jgi:hypothetical protein
MSELSRIHYALGYLSGAMALWAALRVLPETGRRQAWLKLKARDMVTHDRILTCYPRGEA